MMLNTLKKLKACLQISTFLLLGLFASISDAQTQLINYLGTGSNPSLHLELSANNGPGWASFNIDYQQSGNVPYSSDPTKDWSPWNVKDENGNYYGTITLDSDGSQTTFGNYTSGNNGYYLEGIHFSPGAQPETYQITVDKIHGFAGPFPDAPIATPAIRVDGTKIIFSVKGNKIIDDQNTPVILKGVVRPSLEWNPQGENLSAQDINNMHKFGANTVRVDLNQNYWLNSAPVTQKGSYKQIINAIVYYAIQNHMAVILDLHWTENGHQNPMANQQSLLFWKQVATDYQHFGTVLFELFNEPNSINPTTWLNGNDQYAGYQQLVDTVRSTGAQNICIINGLDWGYDLSFVNDNFRVSSNNIVYGSHPYNDKGSNGYTGPGGDFDHNFKNLLGKYPLIFTEFGVNQGSYFPNGYQQVYQTDLDYANKNQISYTAFAWWVENDPNKANIFPDIINDWSGTPLNGGILIHQDMQNVPGTPIGTTQSHSKN